MIEQIEYVRFREILYWRKAVPHQPRKFLSTIEKELCSWIASVKWVSEIAMLTYDLLLGKTGVTQICISRDKEEINLHIQPGFQIMVKCHYFQQVYLGKHFNSAASIEKRQTLPFFSKNGWDFQCGLGTFMRICLWLNWLMGLNSAWQMGNWHSPSHPALWQPGKCPCFYFLRKEYLQWGKKQRGPLPGNGKWSLGFS